jgi:hypothetical protein
MHAPVVSPAVRHPNGERLLAIPLDLADQVERQNGVLTRHQLHRAGFNDGRIRAAIDARRWRALGRNVVVLHNAALTAVQRDWVAILLPGKLAALASLSALASWGLSGFPSDCVHVVVARDSNVGWPQWVKVHNSRRFSSADVDATSIPRTGIDRSAIDAAGWSPQPRRAAALICAVVQQRLTTARRLE